MTTETFFELNEPPYRMSPDPRFLLYSAQVREAVEKCKYMTTNRIGPLYLYGPIGSGKTTLLRQLYGLFKHNKSFTVANLISPNIKTSNTFLRVIMDEFGVKTHRSYADSLKSLERFLVAQFKSGQLPILIVDEAQNMNFDMLRLIHYLLNFETTKAKLLQIVMAGQLELANRIQRFSELASRMFPIPLGGMSPTDLDAMIDYRWMVAGGNTAPFGKKARDGLRSLKGSASRRCQALRRGTPIHGGQEA